MIISYTKLFVIIIFMSFTYEGIASRFLYASKGEFVDKITLKWEIEKGDGTIIVYDKKPFNTPIATYNIKLENGFKTVKADQYKGGRDLYFILKKTGSNNKDEIIGYTKEILYETPKLTAPVNNLILKIGQSAILKWTPIGQAQEYEIQIAPKGSKWSEEYGFKSTNLVTSYTTTTSHKLKGVTSGEFQYSVRAVSTNKKKTSVYTTPRTFKVKSVYALNTPNMTPLGIGFTTDNPINFEWQAVNDVANVEYIIQISQSNTAWSEEYGFSDVYIEERTKENSYSTQLFRAGTYSWTVRAISEDDKASAYSTPEDFGIIDMKTLGHPKKEPSIKRGEFSITSELVMVPSADKNSEIGIQFFIENKISSKRKIVIQYYLSITEKYDNQSILLRSLKGDKGYSLNANDFTNIKEEIRIPDSIASGAYYILCIPMIDNKAVEEEIKIKAITIN